MSALMPVRLANGSYAFSLVPEQADEVRRAGDLGGIGVLEALWVTVTCRACGETVGQLGEKMLADDADDNYMREVLTDGIPLGLIFIGKVKSEGRPANWKPTGRAHFDDPYTALLQRPSSRHLPEALPLWCSRHHEQTVRRATLLSHAGKARKLDHRLRVRAQLQRSR